MIATIQHAVASVLDLFRFFVAVWHDARQLQHDAEDKYGLLGF